MHMAPRAAAWVAWAVWTCNTPNKGIRSKESGLRSALFFCAVPKVAGDSSRLDRGLCGMLQTLTP